MIFDTKGVDRIPSKLLVDDLCDLDDGVWSEWGGLRGDQQPRKLSSASLATLPKPFKIKSKKYWPPRRDPTTKSFRGYFRSQFELAWAAYCGQDGTPAQSSRIRHLRSV